MFEERTIMEEAKAFLADEWETVIGDIADLIAVESTRGEADEAAEAPYGPGPRAVLDCALAKAEAYGFAIEDAQGQVGIADWRGADERQLLIIGHIDVVPAGDGWHFPAFELTRKDGFLIGRGTTDDKGPLLCALHALRFWKQRCEARGELPPHSVRMLFGCNEETGMQDADWYLAHYPAPDFLITPDAEFPVCYGEKGQLQVLLKSAPLIGGDILEFESGMAVNAVPSSATALVRTKKGRLPETDRIAIEPCWEPEVANGVACGCFEGTVRVRARGIGGHAAEPEGSLNAIKILVDYLLGQGIGTVEERRWLGFVKRIVDVTDGSGLGIAASDDDFGPLTCVGGMARRAGDRFTQTIDVRFPTTTTIAGMLAKVDEAVAEIGAVAEPLSQVEPLLVDPNTPQIRALKEAYEQVAGRTAAPFTMGGGTYAHHFPVGVSYGAMDDETFPKPAWVGSMHGADEGIAEDALKQALLIYIIAFGKLLDVGF